MLCKYCGNEVSENNKFCSKCGGKVEAEIAPEAVPAEAEPKKKNTGIIAAVIMAAVLLLQNLISFVSSLGFSSMWLNHKYGMSLDHIITMFKTNLTLASVRILLPAVLGAALVVAVILIRKNKLEALKIRDAITFCVYIIASGVLGYGLSLFSAYVTGRYGEFTLAAMSAANAVLALTSLSILTGWLVLAMFILARSGARVASLIFWICLTCLPLIGAVIAIVFSMTLLRLYSTAPAVLDVASTYIRISALVNLIPGVVTPLFWYAYGSRKIGFVPAIIYGVFQPILNLGCGILGLFLVMNVFHLSMAYVGLGNALAYILGGTYVLIFALIGFITAAKKKA